MFISCNVDRLPSSYISSVENIAPNSPSRPISFGSPATLIDFLKLHNHMGSFAGLMDYCVHHSGLAHV